MLQEEQEQKPHKKISLWRVLQGQEADLDLVKESRELPSHDSFSLSMAATNVSDALFGGKEFDPDEYMATEYFLPTDRMGKYLYFDQMAKDSVIDSAISFHLDSALSPKVSTGEVLRIEATSNEDDPILKDLIATLQDNFNKNIRAWMYSSVKNGVSYVLPYVEEGVGITSIRFDYYTRPDQIKEFEKGGTRIGYLHKKQIENNKKGMLTLLPDWRFVSFKMPACDVEKDNEPLWKDSLKFDIEAGSPANEDPIETQDYGQSIIETSYSPYTSFKKATRSLDIAREQAGKTERFVTVNTGNTSPTAGAKYFSAVAMLFKRKKSRQQKAQFEKGARPLVTNTIIPVQGEVTINTETNDVNIAHIDDVEFTTARLAGSLHVDKALLGFTENLGGGLGDGGFNQVSLAAGAKASAIRLIAMEGLERLCELHVFWKYGKVYDQNTKPWKITFDSMTTAIEREEQAAEDVKINAGVQFATLMQTIDMDGTLFDKTEIAKRVLTRILSLTEDEFKQLLAPPPKAGDIPAVGPDGKPVPPKSPPKPPVFDAVDLINNPELKSTVYQLMTNILES
jgi:hypothetical protein